MNVRLLENGWKETDYTGRWSIERYNDDYYLQIECFNIKDIAVYEDKKFLWFKYKKKVGTKMWVFTRWVAEEDLEVAITEEYINECGSCE